MELDQTTNNVPGPSFSSLAPLVALSLGYLVARGQQPCSHISRPVGQKACLCSVIPSKRLPASPGLCVGYMSGHEPITGSGLGDCEGGG